MNIWVDADACPGAIKELLYRAAVSRIGLNNTAMDTSEDPKNKIKAIVADRGTTVRTSPTDGLQTAVCEKQMSPAERAARVFKTMDEVAGFSADARLTREAAHER